MLALFKVKSWSIFVLWCLYFWKSHSPWRKKRIKNRKQAKHTQFLTLEFCYFCLLFSSETQIFVVFSAKLQNWKKHKKEKNYTICEHICANCSCQNVRFFFLHFSFCCFGISMFSEMFFIGFQKSKANKTWKQQKQKKTTTTRKQDAKQKPI